MLKYLVVGFAVLGASAALAHSELSASMPADEAVLDAAPEQLMLHFSAPVRLTALAVQQRGGATQDLGPLPAGANKDFAVPAAGLTRGEYVVRWRALAADTHVMTGEFTFTVSGGAGDEAHGAAR